MEERDILERIVVENGNCSFAGPDICAKCPMSRLKQKNNGDFYSCVEALDAYDKTSEEQDKIYKDAANKLLLDLNIEDMLRK